MSATEARTGAQTLNVATIVSAMLLATCVIGPPSSPPPCHEGFCGGHGFVVWGLVNGTADQARQWLDDRPTRPPAGVTMQLCRNGECTLAPRLVPGLGGTTGCTTGGEGVSFCAITRAGGANCGRPRATFVPAAGGKHPVCITVETSGYHPAYPLRDGDTYRFTLTDDAGNVLVDLEETVTFTETPIDPEKCDPEEWSGPCRFAHLRFETPEVSLAYAPDSSGDAGGD